MEQSPFTIHAVGEVIMPDDPRHPLYDDNTKADEPAEQEE
jgi:hypothetical protein